MAIMRAIINLGIYLLEGMFALGLVGSTIILFVTAIEDLETLFGSEESHLH